MCVVPQPVYPVVYGRCLPRGMGGVSTGSPLKWLGQNSFPALSPNCSPACILRSHVEQRKHSGWNTYGGEGKRGGRGGY